MPNPPITVGELTDVPAPESPINAQYMQEVAHRIVHRFASVALMNASNLANGSVAAVADGHYGKLGGVWYELAYITDIGTLRQDLEAVDTNIQSQVTSLQAQLNSMLAGSVRTSYGNVTVPAGHVASALYTITTNLNPASVSEWFGVSVMKWDNSASPARFIPWDYRQLQYTYNPVRLVISADPNVQYFWTISYRGA